MHPHHDRCKEGRAIHASHEDLSLVPAKSGEEVLSNGFMPFPLFPAFRYSPFEPGKPTRLPSANSPIAVSTKRSYYW